MMKIENKKWHIFTLLFLLSGYSLDIAAAASAAKRFFRRGTQGAAKAASGMVKMTDDVIRDYSKVLDDFSHDITRKVAGINNSEITPLKTEFDEAANAYRKALAKAERGSLVSKQEIADVQKRFGQAHYKLNAKISALEATEMGPLIAAPAPLSPSQRVRAATQARPVQQVRLRSASEGAAPTGEFVHPPVVVQAPAAVQAVIPPAAVQTPVVGGSLISPSAAAATAAQAATIRKTFGQRVAELKPKIIELLTHEKAFRVYGALTVAALSTVIGVLEEIDKQEEKELRLAQEKKVASEKREREAQAQLNALKKEEEIAQRAQLAIQAKEQELQRVTREKQLAQERIAAAAKETERVAKEIGERKLNLQITDNLKNIVDALDKVKKELGVSKDLRKKAELKKEIARLERDYGILGTKMEMVQAFNNTETLIKEVGLPDQLGVVADPSMKEVRDDMLEQLAAIAELKDAFYKEMSRSLKAQVGTINQFAAAKVFPLDPFKKRGIQTVKALEAQLATSIANYKTLVEFARAVSGNK